MNMLLVPVDFSSGLEELVGEASLLAADLACPMVLLHVVEPVAAYVPVGASMDVIAPPPMEQTEEDLSAPKEKLELLAREIRSRGIQAEVQIVTGLAVDEILEQANLRKSRYIILGSHGHGALYHLFGGSVVTGVLKKAACPVLIIPIRKKD